MTRSEVHACLTFVIGTAAILVLGSLAVHLADRRLQQGSWAWRAVHLAVIVVAMARAAVTEWVTETVR